MKKALLMLLVALGLGAGGVRAESPPPAPKQLLLKAPARCEPTTGSRIVRAPSADGRCPQDGSFLRSYTQEELQRTGRTDVGEALRMLDTSLTLQGGRGQSGVR